MRVPTVSSLHPQVGIPLVNRALKILAKASAGLLNTSPLSVHQRTGSFRDEF
jgi:hypothetical protein